jgi:proton-coupled amino acid transporter
VILFSVISIIVFEFNFIGENGVSTTAQGSNMWRFPEFFGVMCFAIEGVGTIMPVRNVMKNRDHFRPMFIMSLGSVCILLLAFGLLGCMTFGSDVKDIVFLNFPKSQLFFFILQMVYGLSCIITFPIYVNVACSIIFRIEVLKKWFIDNPRAYWNCTILRLVTIMMLFAISISGIRILDLLNFSGALCNAYLAIIMPVMLYMAYFKDKIKKWQRVCFWAFIIVGVSMTMLSVVVSVKDMASAKHPKHHT